MSLAASSAGTTSISTQPPSPRSSPRTSSSSSTPSGGRPSVWHAATAAAAASAGSVEASLTLTTVSRKSVAGAPSYKVERDCQANTFRTPGTRPARPSGGRRSSCTRSACEAWDVEPGTGSVLVPASLTVGNSGGAPPSKSVCTAAVERSTAGSLEQLEPVPPPAASGGARASSNATLSRSGFSQRSRDRSASQEVTARAKPEEEEDEDQDDSDPAGSTGSSRAGVGGGCAPSRLPERAPGPSSGSACSSTPAGSVPEIWALLLSSPAEPRPGGEAGVGSQQVFAIAPPPSAATAASRSGTRGEGLASTPPRRCSGVVGRGAFDGGASPPSLPPPPTCRSMKASSRLLM